MTQPPDSVKEQIPLLLPTRQQRRQQLLQLRSQVSPTDRQAWNAHIIRHLRLLLQELAPTSLGVYWPIKGEPDLQNYLQELHEQGMQLALPIVTAKAQPLTFIAWTPGDAMDQDDYGIPIPRSREQTILPDALLIPCVGFNQLGYRLGYGGGFYDRTLAIMPKVLSIGIAYEISRVSFDKETYDLALNKIITELGCLDSTA